MTQMDPCPGCDVNLFDNAIVRHEHIKKCVHELRDELLELKMRTPPDDVLYHQYASAALTGILASGTNIPKERMHDVANTACNFADAMMQQIRKRQK